MDVSLEGLTPDQIASLAMMAKGLASNPNTRGKLLALTKEANPNQYIPEVDLPNEVRAEIAKEREKREALEKKLLEAEVRQRVIDQRNDIKSKKGLSDNDVAEIEKMMVEKGITNHETAADFYQSQKKAAVPTPSSGGFQVSTLPKPDLKPFGGNISQWARQEAVNTIEGIRAGRIAV